MRIIRTTTQISVLILILVFLLIAVRQIGRYTFRIWQIMLGGALAVLITGQISPVEAIRAINPGVMVFLLSMFIIGAGFELSGLLESSMSRISVHAKNGDQLLALILVCMGFLSAILMNDTLAIIGAPLVIALADRFGISPQATLIALCFAVTTGSVFSPIGNPQNYLIASCIPDLSPYLLFFSGLFIPTLLSLGIIWILLRSLFSHATYKGDDTRISTPSEVLLRRVMLVSFVLLFAGVVLTVLQDITGSGITIPFEYIALCAAAPVLLFAPVKSSIIKKVDWRTLVFFAAMFILMQSVYNTGIFGSIIENSGERNIFWILLGGVFISQFISNVPFIALFQPVLLSEGVSPSLALALAAGSTIAGNLTILGAASNVIIIEQAERKGIHISMKFFCTYGIPVTICQLCIYAVFLSYVPIP